MGKQQAVAKNMIRKQKDRGESALQISQVFDRFSRILQRQADGEVLDFDDEMAAHEGQQRMQAWAAIVRQVGPRYARCTLDGFEVYGQAAIQAKQKAILGQIRAFRDDLHLHLERGSSLVLFGPPGTGKDHLMMATLRDAVLGHGCTGQWISCADLFGQVRDQMGSKDTEASLLNALARPQVLAISDPVPPFGDLTNHQATMLFRLIDARYRHRRCTWITVNVADSSEAKQRVGHAVIDRLLHQATGLHCSWPSFRERVPE